MGEGQKEKRTKIEVPVHIAHGSRDYRNLNLKECERAAEKDESAQCWILMIDCARCS